MMSRRLRTGLALAPLFFLPACGDDAAATAGTSALTISDTWVKAADTGMTAAFGTLKNDSDQDIRITGVSTATSPMELHEMAMDGGAMVMRPKEGGIVVPAGGTHEMSPGGDHLMLMDLTDPAQPGETLDFTLTAEDGTTTGFSAQVREFAGAEEEYQGEGHMTGTTGMDMDGQTDPTMDTDMGSTD